MEDLDEDGRGTLKLILKKYSVEDVEQIELVQDRVQWRVLNVDTVIEFWVS